ncbi:hypothetical protein [Cryptosporangium sp. NPDC048952]|uniref:hypothetical protein n=1 Tax=Cryptosporangium sp. NPDC048952 TaxID=3363961 RepID=UPI003712AE00
MPTTAPLARTAAEAHLYMDLHPCDCGEPTFTGPTSIIELGGDDLGSRYEGDCPICGTPREFVFRLPATPSLPTPGTVVYGDGTPSELLDPGEWLWVADRYAGSVPADASALDEAARTQVRTRMSAAIAAMSEVLAFIPADADEVPAEAIRSEVGLAMYEEDPGRFDRDRLEVVRDTYQQLIVPA